ncbi:MAG: M56 family metallopeptidase [Holophagales bacterium]|nr:M56 family metallopeptidase [Holophagales bacterium]MYD23498.1 M56 family metallopeptidase [Holophagales bacterium]MYI31434.1 M56 family metallopeptidase [Holophagales bacterium]
MTAEFSGLADLVVRVTVLLLVALALQWLTRGGPALTRHNLWTLTFALLLALPALRLFGPSWDVPVLPGASGPADDVRLDLARLAFVIWMAGFGVALVSVGVAALRFHKLARVALPLENEAWLRQAEALRKELAIRTEVRLLQGKEILTPMAGGVWKPVILLPASAVRWSEARCRIVLAHELVHVRRCDALRQLAGRAVLAFYWFHPLSWVASYLAAARREEACDERVLSFGVRPSEYAGHLLSLTGDRASVRPVLSLPMAQQSRLERRIRAILRPNRGRPGSALVAAVTALTAGVVAGIFTSVVDPVRQETVRHLGAKGADASDREARKAGRLFVAPVLENDLDQELAQLKVAWNVARHDPVDR